LPIINCELDKNNPLKKILIYALGMYWKPFRFRKQFFDDCNSRGFNNEVRVKKFWKKS